MTIIIKINGLKLTIAAAPTSVSLYDEYLAIIAPAMSVIIPRDATIVLQTPSQTMTPTYQIADLFHLYSTLKTIFPTATYSNTNDQED